MKKYCWSFIILFIPFLLGNIGCQKKTNGTEDKYINQSVIYGIWSMEVNNGNLKGTEEIKLLPSDILLVKDSLTYIGEDSGFEFMLPLKVNLEGNWILKRDSLFINYQFDSINIEPDEDNIQLFSIQEMADKKVFEDLKKEMEKKLSTYVSSFLLESYQAVSNKDLFFGQVLFLKEDTLMFNNNNNRFYLTRISKQ